MRRKLLSVVLCVCMMMTMAPFAFAEGDGDEATPTSTPIGTGDAASSASATVTWTENKNGNLTITEEGAVIDGNGKTYTDGTITVSAANVTIKNLTFGDKAALIVNTTGKFTLTGCTFTPNTVYTAKTTTAPALGIRTAVWLNVGEAVVTNNTFNGVTNGYYNAIEFGIDSSANDLGQATITGNTFNSAIKNNYFNFYNMTANASIEIQNNKFLLANKGSNAIRISNPKNVTGVIFNIDENEYTYVSDSTDSQYEGLILLQDYSGQEDAQNFSGINLNIKNLSAPESAKQLLYVYDDQDGIITTNQPIVQGDDTISKFIVAKIGDNLYTSLQAAISAASDGQTVTLLKNTTESVVIPANKTVNFDLNGNKLTAPTDKRYDAIVNYGKLTIKDSKKTGEIISKKNSGIGIGANSNTTIDYANITGQEGAIGGYKNTVGATLTIKDGIFNGIDNAVVIFNGSERTGNANTITINGGTFNGTIQSSGYVACGIYAPWQDNITVNGGTFNITNGAGIVARAGNVTVTDGEFNTTGNTTGRVGDSRVVVPCSALVFDSGANYPALTGSSKLTINGGKFKSDVNVNNIAVVIPKAGDTNTRVEVTKGYFTSDPTPYCGTKDGKQLTGIPSNDSTYPFTVGTLTANVDVATADPAVKTPSNIDSMPDAEKAVVNNAVSAAAGTTATGLDAIGGKVATDVTNDEVNNAKTTLGKTEGVTVGDQPVTLYVQPYLDITVTGAEVSNTTAGGSTPTTTSLSLEITPMIKKVASTAENEGAIKTEGEGKNAVQIGEAQKVLNVNTPVTIKLALPTGFAQAGEKLSIKHTKENGSIEYYTGIVSTEGTAPDTKTYVTFTTNGFSPFVIYAASANVASIGNNVYPSFQAAVDAAQNNDEITLLKGDAVSATMTGSSKTIKVKASSGVTTPINVTVNGESKTLDNGTAEVTFTYTRPSSSAPTTYAVNVNAATNGAVAADKKTASKGTTVTVTASPSKGYVVDAVKVVDKDGKDVAVTGKDGKYVFTMPGSAVTVTGTFKAETPAPVALPFTDVKSGNWFYDAVKYAYAQGLMTGTSATTFAPNGTMNRAMIVTVLYRLEKSPAVTGASKFTDVPAGQWYSDAVAWAAANKIVNGYDETTFGPMNAVTREQMAAILFRYEQVKGLENVTLEENLNRFPDQNKISAYAIPALQWAVGQKIINGNADGTLDPTGTATRAQVAQIFTNLLNK